MKKILLKTLLPLSAIALVGAGVTSSLVLTSCKNNSPEVTTYNLDGTDWWGRVSGSFINSNHWGWTINDKAKTVTYEFKGHGQIGNVNYVANDLFIPTYVKGIETGNKPYKVVIGDRAFDKRVNPNIYIFGYVYISDGISDIKKSAFYKQNLSGVVLPSSLLTIGDDAFEDCEKLCYVDMSSCKDIISIGEGAFASSVDLETLALSKKIEAIDYFSFAGSSKICNFNIFFDYNDVVGNDNKGAFRDSYGNGSNGIINLFGSGWTADNKGAIGSWLFGTQWVGSSSWTINVIA